MTLDDKLETLPEILMLGEVASLLLIDKKSIKLNENRGTPFIKRQIEYPTNKKGRKVEKRYFKSDVEELITYFKENRSNIEAT